MLGPTGRYSGHGKTPSVAEHCERYWGRGHYLERGRGTWEAKDAVSPCLHLLQVCRLR